MSIDYTNYSDDTMIFDETPKETIEEVLKETVEELPTMMGEIYNAPKVYLREEPNKESAHISILEKGDEVMIDGTEDDGFGNRWYHLITASGNEGYTMAEYVKIVE